MPELDLEPAAREVAGLLDGVTDDHLSAPTPCRDMPVAALLDHLIGLSMAFTEAARKTASGSSAPQSSAEHLDLEWRTVLPQRLQELVESWRDPSAWEGMTEAGGVTMPAQVMGVVAVDELVLHGWDLARATGQSFSCDRASTAAVLEFTAETAKPENDQLREGLFGPAVDVGEDASDLDRALGYAGRDPKWTPAART